MPAQTSGGLIKTSFQSYPEMLEQIDQMAAAEGLSRADIIRRLLRRGLEMERLLRSTEPARKVS